MKNPCSLPTETAQAATAKTNAGAVWILISSVFAASALLPPPDTSGRVAHLPSLCLFYTLTGLPCPGCGLTRSFICLAHGQWRASLHWHPLGLLIALVFLLLWLRCGLFWMRGVTLWPLPPRTAGRLSLLVCLVVLLTGIVRIGWLSAHGLRF